MRRRFAGVGLVAAMALGIILATRARADQVDAFIEGKMQARQTPGVALAVVRNGEVVKAQGYGLANVEHQVPVKPETVFQSGSVGKQFTATAVMLLVEDGRAALDDSVKKFLPAAPASWEPITLRHLLSHTAGMGGYAKDFDFRRDYTEDELLAILYANPLDFAPGEKWQYSNLGYMTLGIVIGKISGQFYGDFLQEKVFRPLGMQSTRIINEADVIPNRAAGYRIEKGELKNQTWVSPTLNTTADGSLYLTVLDLARWDAALDGEKILKRSSLEQMWSPALLRNGKPNEARYGFGWKRGDHGGHTVIEHGGAWQGFTSHTARYPDDRVSVYLLANLSADASPGLEEISRFVAGCYVADLADDRPKGKN
jgi:CubicO group peptidase (beta-lactamase class C family)